jgi:hypothetical protein
MRDRLLVRHFLGRFLENDVISPNADRREVLSVAGGTFMGLSLFVSTIIALQYQFANFLPPGITSMRSLDERFLFVSASMLVTALLAVALWDALALDDRDTAVLGILPLPRSAIVRSKLYAVALLAVGTDVGWNLAPILLRSASLPMTLSVGFKGALVLTAAQGVVTLAAGAFGFLAVLALREGLKAILGQARFRSVSSTLQATLVVALTSALLLLPGSYTNVARNWLARGEIVRMALPPLWFAGLHETLAGSVIDNLPRTKPDPFLVVEERDATALYRSLWPIYPRLGRVAIAALAVAAVLTIVACAWNNRRLPAPVARRGGDRRRASRAWRWLVGRVVARSPLQQAGFWFTLQTLPRRVTHRAVLASAAAVGLSLLVITVRERVMAVQTDIASVPLAILAAQSLVLTAVLTGFRHAAQLPAELRASVTFSLAWSGNLRPYLSGVKRAGWIALVLPVLAGLFVWHSAVLGVRVALLHFGMGAAFSTITMEVLFLRYPRLPLVSGYVPSGDLKSRGAAYVAAVFLVCYVLAWIERAALAATFTHVLVLVSVVGGLSMAVAAYDRASQSSAAALDLDEEAPLPTQRLNLAG